MGVHRQERPAHPTSRRLSDSPAPVFADVEEALRAGDDALAEALIERLESAPLDALRPWLEADNPDQRWWGVRLLAKCAAPEATALLSQALSDPDPSVGQCAALVFRQRPNPTAIPSLIKVLSVKNPLLRRMAGDALVALGQPAVPALLAVLDEGSPNARLEATRALALIADPQAIPALYRVLGEESQLMDYWANEGLERMGVGMVYFLP